MISKLIKIAALSLLPTITFNAQSQAQINITKPVNEQIIEKFYVVGIAARTTNKNSQSSKDIEALWLKFWKEDVQNKIPNKVGDEIYAAYFDYETDFTGQYTTLIGLPVSSLNNIPEGFAGITIDKSNYQQFISRGKMPKAVFSTWLEIWNNKELNSKRAYKVDFTIHGKKYYDGEHAEVETYISVR